MSGQGIPKVTIEERILIHLMDFSRFKDEVEVPANITQAGISFAVGVERKHVPRSIKSMADKGFVSERTTHVKGKTQRMKTYFLTHTGEAEARRLRDFVRGSVIKIKSEGGRVTEVPILEACQMFDGAYSLCEVLSYLSEDAVFDPKVVEAARAKDKTDAKTDALAVYRSALEQAWKDGKMTADEKEMLRSLRESLSVTEKEHLAMESEILEAAEASADSQALEVYRVALEQALDDGKITDDERAILERIRKRFNIKD